MVWPRPPHTVDGDQSLEGSGAVATTHSRADTGQGPTILAATTTRHRRYRGMESFARKGWDRIAHPARQGGIVTGAAALVTRKAAARS